MKRRELHLPLACSLLGVLWAICWAMVHRQSDLDRTRVTLDQSVPLAIAGLVCGAALGLLLQRAVTAWPALARVLEAALVPALAGSIAAPLGWIFRDAALDWSGEEAIVRAGTYGLVAGAALYTVARVVQHLSQTRKAAEPDVAPDRRPST